MELLYERDRFEPPPCGKAAPEYTCKSFDLQPVEIPDVCAEVIELAHNKFTTRRQWSYLHVYCELILRNYGGRS